MNREFTGRHMAMVLIIGFGIVAIVNFYMASLATGGFHGVVVENTYVASQKFNDWIDEAKKDEALGWTAEMFRDDAGHVIATTIGVPEGATVTAELRRPLGTKEFASLTFARGEDGVFRSTESVKPGRWTARLNITSGDLSWDSESEIR
ncbi:MAG: FixH family protein [Pseudomonadota bacterium]